MNVMEIRIPSRHVGGIHVCFDDGVIYNLREEHAQEYYRARLAYYVSGQRGSEPSLREYVLQYGEKMENLEMANELGLTVQTVIDDITKNVHGSQCDCGCGTTFDVVAPAAPQIAMDVYAIRNTDGKWFNKRTDKGWVDNLTKARLYSKAKLGHARAIVTHYAKQSGNTNIPSIVKFTTVATEVSDEKARLEQVRLAEQRRRDRREQEAKKRQLEVARRKFEQAKAEFEAEQKRLLVK